MKMIMIALGALLVLGGGGAGAYFYFTKSAEASIGEEAEMLAEEHAKAEKDSHGHDSRYSEFVEINNILLPIVDENGVSQVLSLVVALEVPNVLVKDEVRAMAPKLKDAFIQDMYGVLNEHAALKGGVLQVGMLKKRLNRVSVEVMGEDKIQDVLLQVIQQRPI